MRRDASRTRSRSAPGRCRFGLPALHRLRLHGLIRRVEGQHRYVLTDDGQRSRSSPPKLGERDLPALFAADQPNGPPQLRRARAVIGGCVDGYLADAGLAAA